MKEKGFRRLGRPKDSDIKQPTNELILQEALRLFLENGYLNVSIASVANKCDVTKASVYYYYASKAELFTEAMIMLMIRIRDQIQIFLEEELPLKTRLVKITKIHLEKTIDIDVENYLKGARKELSESQLEKIKQSEEEMYQVLESAFRQAIDSEEIRPFHPAFLTHSYVSLLKVGYMNKQHPTLTYSVEETAEQLIELLWHGINVTN